MNIKDSKNQNGEIELPAEIKKIRETVGQLSTEFNNLNTEIKSILVVKGNDDGDEDDMPMKKKEMQEMMGKFWESIGRMMDNIHQRIDYTNKRIYESENALWEYKSKHSVGHLPSLSGSQMKKVLAKCGLEEDFSVQTPVVYASQTRRGLVFTA